MSFSWLTSWFAYMFQRLAEVLPKPVRRRKVRRAVLCSPSFGGWCPVTSNTGFRQLPLCVAVLRHWLTVESHCLVLEYLLNEIQFRVSQDVSQTWKRQRTRCLRHRNGNLPQLNPGPHHHHLWWFIQHGWCLKQEMVEGWAPLAVLNTIISMRTLSLSVVEPAADLMSDCYSPWIQYCFNSWGVGGSKKNNNHLGVA